MDNAFETKGPHGTGRKELLLLGKHSLGPPELVPQFSGLWPEWFKCRNRIILSITKALWLVIYMRKVTIASLCCAEWQAAFVPHGAHFIENCICNHLTAVIWQWMYVLAGEREAAIGGILNIAWTTTSTIFKTAIVTHFKVGVKILTPFTLLKKVQRAAYAIHIHKAVILNWRNCFEKQFTKEWPISK